MTDHVSELVGVKARAIRSVKWSVLMQVVSRVATPLFFVILTRILDRDDYGVMAIGLIVVGFAQIFWDAGLGKTLVRTEGPIEKTADIVFWANLGLGLVIYVILFMGADQLARFFHSPEAAPVIRVLGVTVVILCLTTVHQALMIRDLGFRTLFWVKLATGFVPGIFSIAIALAGWGVWALVGGNVVGAVLNLFLLWHSSPWRPRPHFDLVIARSLFGFSVWVLGESFAAWFFMWGDNLLVGKYLGLGDLGIYQVAWSVNTLLFATIIGALTSILYPTFAHLRQDPQALIDVFHKSNRILMSVTLPMGIGILLIGPRLEALVFGASWHGLGIVMGTIGVLHGFYGMVALNPELYRAIGRPDLNSKLLLLFMFLYLPAYMLAAPHGLMVFTYVRAAVSLLTIPIHAFVCGRVIASSPAYMWDESRAVLGATLAMAMAVVGAELVLENANAPAILILPAMLIVGTSVYVMSLYLMDRAFVVHSWNLVNTVAGFPRRAEVAKVGR